MEFNRFKISKEDQKISLRNSRSLQRRILKDIFANLAKIKPFPCFYTCMFT